MAIRWRCRNPSTGASAAKPIGCGSPGGWSTVNSAGSSVIDVRKAMIMPQPAICPSSERPRYAVGTKDANPSAVAAAARAKGTPAFLAALLSPARRSP